MNRVFSKMERRRSPSSSSRPDRKTIERNRRNQMKALISNLHSIVQQHNSGPSSSGNGVVPVHDQLAGATNYIKRLQIRVERLKEKKHSMMTHREPKVRGGGGSMAPKVEIRRTGTALEVTLITGSDSQLMFKETLRVLEEEGAEILNATYTSTGDAILHSIHCEVGDLEFTPFTCDRISERLRHVVSLQN